MVFRIEYLGTFQILGLRGGLGLQSSMMGSWMTASIFLTLKNVDCVKIEIERSSCCEFSYRKKVRWVGTQLRPTQVVYEKKQGTSGSQQNSTANMSEIFVVHRSASVFQLLTNREARPGLGRNNKHTFEQYSCHWQTQQFDKFNSRISLESDRLKTSQHDFV